MKNLNSFAGLFGSCSPSEAKTQKQDNHPTPHHATPVDAADEELSVESFFAPSDELVA